MTSQTEQQIITIRILPDIPRRQRNFEHVNADWGMPKFQQCNVPTQFWSLFSHAFDFSGNRMQNLDIEALQSRGPVKSFISESLLSASLSASLSILCLFVRIGSLYFPDLLHIIENSTLKTGKVRFSGQKGYKIVLQNIF